VKAGKIISLVGGILYLFFFVGFLFTFLKFKDTYSNMGIRYNYYLTTITLLIFLVLVLANFGYFYYLYIKGKKNEAVKNATVVSVLIVAVPLGLLGLYLGFAMVSILLPLYNVTRAF